MSRFLIMICPVLLWSTACSTDVGSRFGQKGSTGKGGSSSDASSSEANGNKKLEKSRAGGKKKKEEVPEDLIAVPPDEISGSYLTCITPESEGESPETLGCVLVDEEGEKQASTEGMEDTWRINKKDDEQKLHPDKKMLGEKTDLHAMFSFEKGQIKSGIKVTVRLQAKEESTTFSTDEMLKEGSPSLGAFAASIDMDQETTWSEDMESECEFPGSKNDSEASLTLLDDDGTGKGGRPDICPPPF